MAEISVTLTANIRKLEQALAEIKKDLASTGEAAENSAKKISSIGSRPVKSVRNFGKATANATPTLLEFNRLIQDAPFGIQGVANNIQQLTANFGDLRAKTGSTTKALGSMLAGLIGPQGILLAVSLITAGLIAFGDKLFKAGNKTEELKKKTDALNDSFSLQVERTKLIEENLKNEGKSTVDILKARKSIFQEQLKSLANSIEQQKKQVQLQITENRRLSGYEALSAVASEIIKKFALELGILRVIEKAAFAIAAANAVLFGIEADKIKAASASAEDKQKELDLTNELQRLENARLKVINDIFNTEKSITGEKLKQAAALPNSFTIIPEGAFNLQRDSFLPTGIEVLEKKAIEVGNKLNAAFAKANPAKAIKAWTSDMEANLLEFNQRAGEIIQQEIGNTFSFLGEAIGAGLASGESIFTAFGKSLLGAMGNFLSSMGDLLIKYGTLAIAKGKIDAALASGNPAVQIGAGLAAIAVGVAVKAAGAAISRTATRGFGSGFGTGAVAGQGGFSSVGGGNFGASGTGTQTVVFEIAGTKLLGVLKNTQERNLRLGGSQLAL